jgi:hypothetical protein
MKKPWGMISYILFFIGLALAVIGGLVFPENPIIALVLVVIGLVIGLIHLWAKDINKLLLATIALLALTAAFAPITLLGIGKMVGSVLIDFAALIAPIALIAAVKALIEVGMQRE